MFNMGKNIRNEMAFCEFQKIEENNLMLPPRVETL